jgi:uncharacterized protein (DUF433 family)
MTIATAKLELPLTADEDGVLRVAGTRVRLETVLTAYEEGATPEEIVQDFSSLTLANVYAVIGYYLQNTATVNEYLSQRTQFRAAARQQTEAQFPQQGIRARLLARQAELLQKEAA